MYTLGLARADGAPVAALLPAGFLDETESSRDYVGKARHDKTVMAAEAKQATGAQNDSARGLKVWQQTAVNRAIRASHTGAKPPDGLTAMGNVQGVPALLDLSSKVLGLLAEHAATLAKVGPDVQLQIDEGKKLYQALEQADATQEQTRASSVMRIVTCRRSFLALLASVPIVRWSQWFTYRRTLPNRRLHPSRLLAHRNVERNIARVLSLEGHRQCLSLRKSVRNSSGDTASVRSIVRCCLRKSRPSPIFSRSFIPFLLRTRCTGFGGTRVWADLMAEYIPFITGDECCTIVKQTYSDAEVVRIPLDRAAKLISSLGPAAKSKVWIDPCVDGLFDLAKRRPTPKRPNSWFEHIKTFSHFDKIGSPDYWPQPNSTEVFAFVSEILNRCAAPPAPIWITVPQIPFSDGAEGNKINRALARATGDWKNQSKFGGQLILPLIATHQTQVNLKTERNPRVRQAERCYQEAHADGFWVVDSSLADDNGSETLGDRRFPGLIAFHEELNESISSKIKIAGPYWGLNLVLWARGLIDFPAIGIGAGYQYFPSGGTASTPTARIALEHLRRRVRVKPRLKTWLEAVTTDLAPSHPASAEFSKIRSQYSALNEPKRAREQVARSYKRWLDAIASAPKAGRSMALYQDLSAAYALGKSLREIEDEGTSRRPESVAKPLMLNCL